MAYNLLRSMEIFGFDLDRLHNAKNKPSIILEFQNWKYGNSLEKEMQSKTVKQLHNINNQLIKD